MQLIVVVFFLVGAGTINANDVDEDENSPSATLTPTPQQFPEFVPHSMPILNIKKRLLTPAEGCGFSSAANTKIVGGSSAKVGAWPWMALLAYKNINGLRDFYFNCGGTLITSRHVLTAAHCVNADLKFVRLAEHDITTSDDGAHVDVKVVKTEKHPNYSRFTKKNDIAILHLARDLDFTDRIRPICIPANRPIRDQSFVGLNPFIAGWGHTHENGTETDVLQQAQVLIHENDVCIEAFRREDHLISEEQFTKEIICAGNLSGGIDSCQGDSGGPLMLPIFENGKFPYYQIGIVAYGIGCGRENLPSAYTNVPLYADWIKEKLR